MKNIDHIVYLMLENRSLDHVLGWLYETDKPKHFIPSLNPPPYNGLQTIPPHYNPDSNGVHHPVWQIPRSQDPNLPTTDPNEPYENVNNQLYGSPNNPPPGAVPGMMGFYKDFATVSDDPNQIMGSYTLDSLTVLNYLAKTFAVSDAYHASVPTQTNCNRAFAGTGNSVGHYWWRPERLEAWVNNNFADVPPWSLDVTFNQRTMWDVLTEQGFGSVDDWMIFYNQTWPDNEGNYCFTQDLFWPTMKDRTAHFSDIQNFFNMIGQGKLPKFSFLEPAWYLSTFGNGNDYHPPANLPPGEQFLFAVYYSIRRQPKLWANTLIIINFDEHGGTYDHQAPPTNAIQPWADPAHGTPVPQAYEKGFDFKRFGVRVPLILASPLVEESTVFRSGGAIPFDHTSVIATILTHFGIDKDDWKLGSRTYNAPMFGHVVSRDEPRMDIPDLEQPDYLPSPSTEDLPPNDLQQMVLHRMIARELQKANFPREKYQELYDAHFRGVRTMRELDQAKERVLGMVRN